MNKSVALILAGGVGNRMNLTIPKQFVMVDGLSVLQHTMSAFQQHMLISAIYVVCSPEWQNNVRQQAKAAGITKFVQCINSGENSFLSARNGIKAIQEKEEESTVVLIHDSVRPLISQDIISSNISVCLSRGNAITSLQSQESYMLIDKTETKSNDIVSSEYILREDILRAQTPHTFRLKELAEMFAEADERGITYSQSIFTLACELGHVPLYPAKGEMINFKLTMPSDIILFQAILHQIRG